MRKNPYLSDPVRLRFRSQEAQDMRKNPYLSDPADSRQTRRFPKTPLTHHWHDQAVALWRAGHL